MAQGKKLAVLAGVTLGTLAVAGTFVFYLICWKGKPGENKEVLIPRGTSMTGIVNLLHDNGVVGNKMLFKYLLKFTGGQSRLRAGEYRFQTDMRLIDALFVLYNGEPILHPVTIPEGYNARQIAGLVAKAGIGSEAKFNKIVFDPASPKKYKLNSPSLEGFLFPDTYSFSKIDGEEKIVDRMVQEFFKRIDATLREEIARSGMTLEQFVTLASIVEKETGNTEERNLVASVFHNRLKKKQRLESDPTIIYGIENFDGDIKFKDIRRNHPYNTYVIKGLPPGPIASPGYATMLATLRPATTNYYFFVGNNNGKHAFSETYEQHLKLVKQYQRRGLVNNNVPNQPVKTPPQSNNAREPKSAKQRALAGKKGKK